MYYHNKSLFNLISAFIYDAFSVIFVFPVLPTVVTV